MACSVCVRLKAFYEPESEQHVVRCKMITRLVCALKDFSLASPESHTTGFPGESVGKESACNAGDLDSIRGSERSPGEGNGNPPKYSCLENPMDRGA